MTHQEALKEHAPERYLLGELSGKERERFEEHLFSCTLCAADVESGALFMGAARQHLVEGSSLAATQSAKKKRLLFFRPAAAFAFAAVLLLMVGYQNLVQLPRLRNQLAQAEAPAVLHELVMAGGDSRGAGTVVPSVTLGAADAMLLTVDVPQGLRYERYRLSLQPQTGPEVWHTVLPAAATENAIPLHIPAHMLGEGEYRLLVRGIATGQSAAGSVGEPIADYPFAVRRQHE